MGIYGAALGTFLFTLGLPTDFFLLFVWLWLATVAWNIDQPRGFHLRWLKDWGPLLALLIFYDLSRAAAKLFQAPHIKELPAADRAMFGGTLPTTWLQDKLYDPNHVHWWDVFASFVYMSHFVAAMTVAVVLYLRSRALWTAFMRRFLFLTAAGLLTYFVYPAAPPWWASKFGYITEHVERTSGRGWGAIGLQGTGKMLGAGQAMSNPVAAMPSLHSGWAMLIIAFFLPFVRKRWWPLLFAYPLSMTFTLVYTGDHYIIDVLVAWTYVALAFIIVGATERWWARRKRERAEANAPMSPAVASSPLTAVN
ncbi:MAG: phosphatase PAP2 family protein [Corynebacteriales bacterium]|nr:phosphatase PAP2 family protein [Mycobacteriales bacterium]